MSLFFPQAFCWWLALSPLFILALLDRRETSELVIVCHEYIKIKWGDELEARWNLIGFYPAPCVREANARWSREIRDSDTKC